jgi:hypothetical protein
MTKQTTFVCLLLVGMVAVATSASLRTHEERRATKASMHLMAECDEEACKAKKNHVCLEGKCQCQPGFSGEECLTPPCPCNKAGGTCSTDGKCDCFPGFKGEHCFEYACPNNCTSTAAVNRATGCSDGKCECRAGFAGNECEVQACQSETGEICAGHGTCNAATKTCKCNLGWVGVHCSEKSECKPACGPKGSCLAGVCQCATGFRGETCEKTMCADDNGKKCSGHGACNFAADGITELSCKCNNGFTGPQCQIKGCPKDSSGRVCGGVDRGSCNTDGLCECKCDIDLKNPDPRKCFSGPDCSIAACAATTATTDVCHKHGQCVITNSGTDTALVCKCESGYYGTTCENAECPFGLGGLKCSGKAHGYCADGQCICEGGWGGEACQTTSCTKSPDGKMCGGSGKGKCDEAAGMCACEPGFAGADCSQKDCAKPCQNGGMCQGGSCVCGPKHTGQQCELLRCTEGNPGAGRACAAGGVCNNGRCDCKEGYYGTACEFKNCPSSADGKNCSGHGMCYKSGPSAGTCTCSAGWTSADCSSLACPLGCSKRGKCVDGKCACNEGWMGPGCEEKSCPLTHGKMCSGHGACTNGTCACDVYKDAGHNIIGGYFGEQTCHIPFCGAHSNITAGCSGAGICQNKRCKCKPGFYGEYCGKEACPDMCNAKTGNGKCDGHGGCVCTDGYEGPSCAQSYCNPVNCSGHGVCDPKARKCICDKTDAFAYTGESCNVLVGPENDEEATRKAKEFAAKLNETLKREKEASDAHELATKLQEEATKHTMSNGEVLNATKREMSNLKHKQKSASDALKELEKDLTTLNMTATAMANKAKDERLEKEAKVKLTKEETVKAKKKKVLEERMKVGQKKQCRAENGQTCGGRGECIDGHCICDAGFDATNNCMYAMCPNACYGNGECLQGQCLCDEVHTGADCSMKICSEDCGKSGWCNNGTCACELGYGPGFPNCDKKVQKSEALALGMACPLKCSGRGTCDEGVCKCDIGFGGVGCEEKVCPAGCSNHGACVKGSCVCDKGFAGAGCSEKDCSAHNHCSGPKNGKCLNGTCACIAPFTGKACDIKENKCLNSCSGHGKCIDSVCYCAASWVGRDCHKQICIMDDPSCSGHGNCTGATCTCRAGWTGSLCEIKVLKCPKGCSGNGVCDTASGKCACNSKFTGVACDSKACDHPCHNNGKCSNGTCKCAPGWAGKMCRQPTCKNDCSGNGKCVSNDDDAGKHCECRKGFQGDDCSENVAGCLAKNGKECAGNGVCILGKCDCAEGFSGALCTISLCDPMDCNGNGRCVNGTCVCKPSWSGDACDEKECPVVEGVKCAGHGVCTQLGCKCKRGWCGEGCQDVEKVKKPCPGTPMCSGHGACREDGDSGAKCVCDSGFTDLDCSVSDCPMSCSGHGVCNNETLKCSCIPGFTGEGCDKKTCEGGCGHGRCVDGACMCTRGWGGDNCTTELCPDNCGAHGNCVDEARCVCKNGFSGRGCTVAPGCPDGCSDHGVCEPVPGMKGSKCKCNQGFAGLACEVEICPGAATGAMCSGHGKCNNKKLLVGVESACVCKKGWTGVVCATPVCPKACSGHGDCDLDKKKCTCAIGWKGEDCGNQGCDKGFMTADPARPCGKQFCDPVDCNGHGECSAAAMKCVCEAGWSGAGCGVSLCKDACNGNGACRPIEGKPEAGVCDCKPGFNGHYCENNYCGDAAACSNHGKCDHSLQQCQCSIGFNGPHCNNTYCGIDGLCNNHGVCNSKHSKCDCHPGFAGELCSHKQELKTQSAAHSDTIIPIVSASSNKNVSTAESQAMIKSIDDTAVQLFQTFPKRAVKIAEVATRAADGNYAVAKKFGDTMMSVAADLVLQSCDYKCNLADVAPADVNTILSQLVDADKLLSAHMDRKQIKIALLQFALQRALGRKSVTADALTKKLAAFSYDEYELSFSSAIKLIRTAVPLMKEIAEYTKTSPVSEGELSLTALAAADMVMKKARSMTEEALVKRFVKKTFPAVEDDVAREVATKALLLAKVDDALPCKEVMEPANAAALKLVTTSKAHSFYRGNDDGAPTVDDAESAYKFLSQTGGDEKSALAMMKVEEVVKEATEAGKNMTKEQAADAVKMSGGNFNTAVRGLGLRGKNATTCPNNCNGHGQCVGGVCQCEKAYAGSADCRKPVATAKECYVCCAYEGLDSCKHVFTSTNTKAYDKCYKEATDSCVQKCTSGDKMQQASCVHSLDKVQENGHSQKLPPSLSKMVDQLAASRVAF